RRGVFGELMQCPEPLRHVGTIMEGSDVRYEMPAGRAGPHPLAGRLAPDLRLGTGGAGTRGGELVQSARGVLLDLSDPGGVLTANGALAGAASGWPGRVGVTTARPV